LIKRIAIDQKKRLENPIDEPLKISIMPDQSTSKLNGEFLHFQLLIDCLLRMKTDETNRQELIDFIRQIYKFNSSQLNLVKEFTENYSSQRALWWYTRESFVYRLLNKALRVQNIDLLYQFRFVLSDLEQELKQMQCSTPQLVYRGQLMSKDELHSLKKSLGEYISIHSLFSTSLKKQKALEFLNTYSFSNDLETVLFEITANLSSTQSMKPFANISSKSFYSTEHEVLFMSGCVFQLISYQQENNLHVFRLTTAEDQQDYHRLFQNIKNEYSAINDQPSLLTFANLLHQMGRYDLAEKYFRKFLNDPSSNPDDLPKCYYALGILTLINDQYDTSLEWHKKSLQLLSPTDPHLADSYNCIGCIYQKKGDYQQALDYYGQAWQIWTQSFGEEYYKIADCLNNIGCIYEKLDNYSTALEYHQKALVLRQKYLPANHSDLGASYNNIGNVYFLLQKYDFALENYQKAYEIKLQSLPNQHVSLALTLENIGLVYEEKQWLKQALDYYQRAAKIFREIFSKTHAHVIEIDNNIQRIKSILKS